MASVKGRELRQFRRDAGYRWRDRIIPDPPIDSSIFEGRPGEGKTLLLTREALSLMRDGIAVSSNYTIQDVVTGNRADPCRDWVDMMRQSVTALRTETPRVFIISEIHLWAGARDTARTPRWWLALMAMRRYYNVAIIGDTQNLRRVEIVLRELVDQVVQVRRPRIVRWGERVTNRAIGLRTLQKMDATELERGREFYHALSNPTPALVPWYCYHSYDTRQMVRPEQYEADDELKAEIADLTALADEAVAPEGFYCFDEWVEDRRLKADLMSKEGS